MSNARPYIDDSAEAAPVAICGRCGARGPVKVQRTKSGNIAVAYLPDGWRFLPSPLGDGCQCADCEEKADGN